MDLNNVWYSLIFLLLTGYAVLDGFDLGVGVLHLFARNDHERRVHLNAIGPVWDGNEVWLLTGGGALFAAFPPVYATVFSGFYLALMLVLTALICRAVSMEFRGKIESESWKWLWDWAFGLGSLVAALLFGVAFGNVLRGVPIDETGRYVGSFLGLLNPYSLLVGLTGLAMLILHGAAYLTLKSEGELQDRVRRWVPRAWQVFVALYVVATIATFFSAPHLFDGVAPRALFWVFLVMMLGAVIYSRLAHQAGRHLATFLATSLTIIAVMGLAGVSLYPRLVPSSLDLANSLTAYNSSSTPRTLTTMLIIALIGVPLVLVYTALIYRAFRGKVEITDSSY
jgi:cytochrome d ubiquinol oxidase subunit II